MINNLKIQTKKRKEIIDLTERINQLLASQQKNEGVTIVFVAHTTCCLTTGEVDEGTDDDLLEVAEKIVPKISFRHVHDPSHAWTHMASSIIGSSLSLPFENKKLILGTWQSVLLLELDGPRERLVVMAV